MPIDWDELIREHERVIDAILASVDSPIPEIPVPSLMVIAVQRSRAMVEAYRVLVGERNLIVASALIRMQLDSLMRVHACSLVNDPMDLWTALEADDRWSKVKSRDGNPLTDAFLREQLSLKHPWVSDLYTQMSGYVHLGRPYLDAVVVGTPFLGMVLSVGPAGHRVKDNEVGANIDRMQLVTHALLDACRSEVARGVAT